MANYDFTTTLSPLDFELISKDLLEADLGIRFENFREGKDGGIDLRYAHAMPERTDAVATGIVVQCKRYSDFANLKAALKHSELPKIRQLNPSRYILSTSVSLSRHQVDELAELLAPHVRSTGDIYGRDRLNAILTKHPDIERQHIKLWMHSTGVLDSIINAGTHVVSREEIEFAMRAAKLYVHNPSFGEALNILHHHRVCIISGLPGIGKTTLARMLLLYFYKHGYEVIKIGSDIDEARTVGYHSKPRFFYYDDFLGQTARADKLNKNEDHRLLAFMRSIRDSKESVFVLTTREYILNQARMRYEVLSREKFDQRLCIIDLSKYSRRICAQILYNHLHFSKIPRSYLESLVTSRGYIAIVDHKNYNPRLVEYLTDAECIGEIDPASYPAQFLQKLDNPAEIWDHAFRRQISTQSRHLLFVLTTMPKEVRLEDVKTAFGAVHKASAVSASPSDFRDALKELDGTFITTQQNGGLILLQFQNPSIRDFMRALIFSGEMLEELISHLVFFEQAQWFIEILDEAPGIPYPGRRKLTADLPHVKRLVPELVKKLYNLIDAPSCELRSYRINGRDVLSVEQKDTVERVGDVAAKCDALSIAIDREWLDERLDDVTEELLGNRLHLNMVVWPIQRLHKLGLLGSNSGVRLFQELKECVMEEMTDLHGFETAAALASGISGVFSEEELEGIRAGFGDLIEDYAAKSDARKPEDLRSEASIIDDIGTMLDIDTEDLQQELRDAADDIEKNSDQDWEPDDDRPSTGSHEVECTNDELESMFGTL